MEPLPLVEWTLVVVTSMISIVAAMWAMMSWQRRPRFIVGVPPSEIEQKAKGIPASKIGRKSIVSQFRHSPSCMALRIGEKRTLSAQDIQRVFSNPLRTRSVKLDSKYKGSLPVVVENVGRRAAREYKLGIQILNPHVHVTDIVTESLSVGAFYATDPNAVKGDGLKCVDTRIVEGYDSYMDVGEEYGDMVFLEGDIEGAMYEMTVMNIKIDPSVERFVIGYTLDCSDFWLSRQAFFQGFVVSKMCRVKGEEAIRS